MYRAYHAIRGLTGPDGRSTNAIYGFVTMLRKLLKDLGFSVQRPRKLLARADPNLQDRWQRYTYPRLKKNR